MKPKLIRITTVPLSLEKLLEGQLAFMNSFFEVIAVSSNKNHLKIYAQKEGVHYYAVNLTRKITPLKDIIAVFKLYLFLKKEKPQIVHTHTPKAGIVGMLAAYFAKVPVRLHTVAGLPLMEAKGVKKELLVFIEKLTYRFATKVYPNSNGLYNYILQEKFTTINKLKIIGNGSSNGINTQYFSVEKYDELLKNQLRNKLNISATDFIYVFVGRLVKDKGIVELVTAFNGINKQHPQTTLLLVGPLEQDLDPLPYPTLQIINTHKKIISVGYQTDVRPYFAISNALVFPSYREGFPNVVLQALAMQLPAIVSNINGCNEIIKNNHNGIIVAPKKVKDLQISMQSLLSNNILYNQLKTNTRTSILKQFDRNDFWQKLLAEYQLQLDKIE